MSERLALRLGVGIARVWAIVALSEVSPRVAGIYTDEGIYLSTAKALAEGRGYRQIQLPGEPWQTKYPPAWPLLLAPVWIAAPSFPQNVVWFKLIGILLWAASLVVGQRLALRLARVPPEASLALLLLAAASPTLLRATEFATTEALFALLGTGGLLLWAPVEAAARGEPGTKRALLAAGMLSLACLARSQGLALLLALLLAQALGRRWRALGVSTLVGAGVIGPWWIWSRLRAPTERLQILDYYTSYGGFLRPDRYADGLGDLVAIVDRHLIEIPLSLGSLLLPQPGRPGFWLGLSLLGLALAGSLRLARQGRWLLPLAVAVTLAMLSVVPWITTRFLLPHLLQLLAVALSGAVALADAWSRGRALVRVGVAVGVVALVAIDGTAIRRELGGRPGDGIPVPSRLSAGAAELAGFAETELWLRRHTRPDAVLASAHDAYWYLATGRRAVRYWSALPADLFLASLTWRRPDFGAPERVLSELRHLGVEWVLIEPRSTLEDPGGRLVVEAGRRLLDLPEAGARRVFVSSDGQHEVWKLAGRDP